MCLKTSGLVRSNGIDDITTHLHEIEQSLFLTDATTDDEFFNIEKLFQSEPDHATWIFLDARLTRRNDPRNVSKEILCFEVEYFWTYEENFENDTLNILKSFNISRLQKEKIAKNFAHFLSIKLPKIFKLYQFADPTRDSSFWKIGDLKNKLTGFNLNWLKIINDQLMADSHVSESDEILVENIELMRQHLNALAELDKRQDLIDLVRITH